MKHRATKHRKAKTTMRLYIERLFIKTKASKKLSKKDKKITLKKKIKKHQKFYIQNVYDESSNNSAILKH